MKVIRLAPKSKYFPSSVRFPSDSNAKPLVGVDALESEVTPPQCLRQVLVGLSAWRRGVRRMGRLSSGPSECSDEGRPAPASHRLRTPIEGCAPVHLRGVVGLVRFEDVLTQQLSATLPFRIDQSGDGGVLIEVSHWPTAGGGTGARRGAAAAAAASGCHSL